MGTFDFPADEQALRVLVQYEPVYIEPTCHGFDDDGKAIWQYQDEDQDTWEYRGPLIVQNGVLDPQCRFRCVP